jgi:hypothetical protein
VPEATQIPPLDELAANPPLADSLPPAAVAVLLGRANLAVAALQARLLAACVESPPRQRATDVNSLADRTLNADEIATELGVNRRWVFRHAKKLSFLKRISRKSLSARLSEVRRWRETQAA